MKQTKTMLRLELEVKPEMAAKCHLAAMAPMMLKGAQEALLSSLEEACGSCDSLCEEFAYPDENAEAILQTVPAELLQKLRERGICMRQLARHLRKGDAVYGR